MTDTDDDHRFLQKMRARLGPGPAASADTPSGGGPAAPVVAFLTGTVYRKTVGPMPVRPPRSGPAAAACAPAC